MAGLTRKELLAGAAAAGVVAGCGGGSKKPAALRGWAAAKAGFPIRSLATRLKEGLAELPKVRLVTPMSPSLSAGIVCVGHTVRRAARPLRNRPVGRRGGRRRGGDRRQSPLTARRAAANCSSSSEKCPMPAR
jgi:hypothetical protein